MKPVNGHATRRGMRRTTRGTPTGRHPRPVLTQPSHHQPGPSLTTPAPAPATRHREHATQPLTCEFCHHSPATHVLILDYDGKTGRRTYLICTGCGDRGKDEARYVAAAPSSVWLYALTEASR